MSDNKGNNKKAIFGIIAAITVISTVIFLPIALNKGDCRDDLVSCYLPEKLRNATEVDTTSTKTTFLPSPLETTNSAYNINDITCPCFSDEDLIQALRHINGMDDTYVFDADTSCTGALETSISYSMKVNTGVRTFRGEGGGASHPVPMGYGVGEGFCRAQDALQVASSEEEDECRSLIEAKCGEMNADN